MRIEKYLRTFLLASAVLAVSAASYGGIFISVGIAPPPLPVYSQPSIPGDGYIWTPGYWGWGSGGGYYWVPGTWVQPPRVGVLWTPGYWGWGGGVYTYNAGYWGPHIGFYGGVNYGFGYGGIGYEGGYWNNGHFAYNTSVNNVSNVHVTNVYNKTVINNTTVNRTSFNGGTGGIQAQPTVAEQAAVHENHVQPTAAQVQHVNAAQNNPLLRASVNGGKPAIAATASPGDFKNAVPARAAGGQVDTSAYKAAAANGGKPPVGGGSSNRAANAVPESTGTAHSGSSSVNSESRPANTTETRIAPSGSPQTVAQPTKEAPPPEAAVAHPESRPVAPPKPVAEPASQPKPNLESTPQSQPKMKPQTKPASETQPHSQPHPQQHPQSKPKSESEEKPKN